MKPRHGAALALLLLALVGCYLPWANHPAAGLSFNAYDLAEQVGLSPAQRGSSLPMHAPFLLRVVLLGIGLLAALSAAARSTPRAYRAVLWLFAVLVAITLQPPLGFFTAAWDDINYQQLFALSVGMLIMLAALFALRRRNLPWAGVSVGVALLVIGACLSGYFTATNVLVALRVQTLLGPGLPLTLASLALYIPLVWRLRRT